MFKANYFLAILLLTAGVIALNNQTVTPPT